MILDLIIPRPCVCRRYARTLGLVASMLASASSITGCASLFAGNQRFAEGWRVGRVLQIDRASEIKVRFAKDCRSPSQASNAGLLVLVRYSTSAGHYGYRVAPAPHFQTLAPDGRVEVNINRCDLAIMRIRDIRPESPTSPEPD